MQVSISGAVVNGRPPMKTFLSLASGKMLISHFWRRRGRRQRQQQQQKKKKQQQQPQPTTNNQQPTTNKQRTTNNEQRTTNNNHHHHHHQLDKMEPRRRWERWSVRIYLDLCHSPSSSLNQCWTWKWLCHRKRTGPVPWIGMYPTNMQRYW